MKIHTLKSRWFLPLLSCVTLSMSSQSNAAVIVYFEQVGSDVVATWTGSIDLGAYWGYDGSYAEYNGAGDVRLFGGGGATEAYTLGIQSSTGFSGNVTNFTGTGGFDTRSFYVGGVADSVAPASSIYDFDTLGVSQTFGGQTLADIGAAAFNNTLAWTSIAGGTNTVSYTTVSAAVPEPSASLLAGLSVFGLLARRKRA